MFISKTHLPQILRPQDYTSREQFDREIETLFRPGWHCVGTLADLPSEGDFLTFSLFGTPLIVWRIDGGVQAFLNVCPHRFSALTDERCGHAGDRLRCRYHGWEFDGTGNTRKIPDAKNFKPLEQGMLGLQSFRTATCGQLIYVTLATEGPDLPEWLGPGYDLGCEIFGADRRHFFTLEQDIGANWKIKLENALESYHVGVVHKETFGKMPDEALCEHEIHETWTSFTSREPAASRVDRLLDRLVHRLARVEHTGAYTHHVFYPYVLFTHGGLLSAVEVLYPVASNRTRGFVHYFCNPGPAGTLTRNCSIRGSAVGERSSSRKSPVKTPNSCPAFNWAWRPACNPRKA